MHRVMYTSSFKTVLRYIQTTLMENGLVKTLILLVASLLCFYSPLKAQKNIDSVSIGTLSLEDLLNITVSVASKSEETAADAPSSVMVFSDIELKQMGIKSIEELFNYIPGFQSSLDVEQGTMHRFSARGRSTALSEAILFLIDGQRMNDLYTGGAGYIQRLIPIANIKKVEIIRGPGSALYGSNAFLGVIEITTKKDQNDVAFEYGSTDSKTASINFSKIVDNIKIAAYAGNFVDAGYEFKNVVDIFGHSEPTRDANKGSDFNLSLGYGNLRLSAHHMSRTLNNFLTFGAIANKINTENTEQFSTALNYEVNPTDNLSIDVSGGYSAENLLTLGLLIPKGTELAPGSVLAEHLIGGPKIGSTNINLNLDANWKTSETNNLSLGVSITNSKISDVANVWSHDPSTFEYLGYLTEWTSPDKNFNGKESRNVLGLYAQFKQLIGKNLAVTAGFRFDSYNDFGSSFNPRAAIVYSTPFDSKIKLMFGRAFRAPNFLELYDKNNPVDFGNTTLNAEQVETIECAYVQSFKMFSGSATYFNNHVKNLIVLGPPVAALENPFGAPTFLNQGDLDTRGLEFEMKAAPVRSLMLSATYTALMSDTKLTMPSSFASLAINLNVDRWNANVNGIYRQKFDRLPLQDSYIIVNTEIRFAVSTDLNLNATVKNLLDQKYYTVTSVLPNGIINRGRTFAFGLSYGY